MMLPEPLTKPFQGSPWCRRAKTAGVRQWGFKGAKVKPDIDQIETQLQVWSLRIDQLVAKTQLAGVEVGFEVHMYVDELKALHAITSSTLDQLRDGNGRERLRLERELVGAWSDLAAAFRKPVSTWFSL